MKDIIRLDEYSQQGFDRGRNGLVVLLWWLVQGTIFRYSLHNMYSYRTSLLKMFGAKVGKGVKVRSSARFTYPWKVEIGDHTWIGDDVSLYSLGPIKIGSNCVISQKSYLCTGSHKLDDPRFSLVVKPIIIENGAWIASDVFVYPGVTIHNLGVAAARSTVLRDIPCNEVHGGFPAKFIKKRFEEVDLK